MTPGRQRGHVHSAGWSGPAGDGSFTGTSASDLPGEWGAFPTATVGELRRLRRDLHDQVGRPANGHTVGDRRSRWERLRRPPARRSGRPRPYARNTAGTTWRSLARTTSEGSSCASTTCPAARTSTSPPISRSPDSLATPSALPRHARPVGAKNAVASCDLRIFVDQAAKPVTAYNTYIGYFDRWSRTSDARLLLPRGRW